MKKDMHYLDNASTTQVAPQVRQVVAQALEQQWANPSALYVAGMRAEEALEKARATVARAMGAVQRPGAAHRVFFTGSGTEANNIAILGAARARRGWGGHMVATGYEHPSVSGPLVALAANEGFALTEIAPGEDGCVDADALVEAVGPETVLVCAMHVNNETGAVLDVERLAARVKEKNSRTFVHVDGVQGFCKLLLVLDNTKIDGYAASGHKLHAPKGVGALYLAGGAAAIAPPFAGGGQESGVRPGTENLPYVMGFAAAVAQAMAGRVEMAARVEALRAALLAGLAGIPGMRVHSPKNGYPGIVMLSMPEGLRSQVMLNLLDEKYGVCVSSGSACSGGAPSHTLQAMGLPARQVDAALRVGFGAGSTMTDVEALLEGLRDCAANLARN